MRALTRVDLAQTDLTVAAKYRALTPALLLFVPTTRIALLFPPPESYPEWSRSTDQPTRQPLLRAACPASTASALGTLGLAGTEHRERQAGPRPRRG